MKNKGAVLVLIVVMFMVMSTFFLYSYQQIVFTGSRDFLFSIYYERAIASALSCREVAMARLTADFQYRTSEIDINISLPQLLNTQNAPKCKFSVSGNGTYIDIYATGIIDAPHSISKLPITAYIKSTVSISYTNPKIISTSIVF